MRKIFLITILMGFTAYNAQAFQIFKTEKIQESRRASSLLASSEDTCTDFSGTYEGMCFDEANPTILEIKQVGCASIYSDGEHLAIGETRTETRVHKDYNYSSFSFMGWSQDKTRLNYDQFIVQKIGNAKTTQLNLNSEIFLESGDLVVQTQVGDETSTCFFKRK